MGDASKDCNPPSITRDALKTASITDSAAWRVVEKQQHSRIAQRVICVGVDLPLRLAMPDAQQVQRFFNGLPDGAPILLESGVKVKRYTVSGAGWG
jgi:hypothetical protein